MDTFSGPNGVRINGVWLYYEEVWHLNSLQPWSYLKLYLHTHLNKLRN